MQNYNEDQNDSLLKKHRNKPIIGQRLRYSFQNTSTIQQIYTGHSKGNKSSPQRENILRTTINLPKTPTLFYSLRRQPKRNINTLTQSQQIQRRNTVQLQTGISVNLDYDYGQISEVEVLEVSQRPTAQKLDDRRKSVASRMQQRDKFKTLEQSNEHRRTQSQLASQTDLSFERATQCPNCAKKSQKIVSMTNQVEQMEKQIQVMLQDISQLTADLSQAKFLLIESKVAKENQSIKRCHLTENLELKVKLLQDSLILRNQQYQEQEKQNQSLVKMLEQYDTRLELAQEQLQVKESTSAKQDVIDLKIIEETMAYHYERLQNLKVLKKKAANFTNVKINDISKISFGDIPSNFRQSQKSINDSNYSSEPLLANVTFN